MSLLLVFGAAILYIIAYHTYGRFIARKLFRIDPALKTPAHVMRDDRDYVPTRRAILFGHHYTSIAGTGPIVGPAIGVIWGWLPALLWVLFGSIFMGAVHDFAALIISARQRGQSIGEITGELISPRVRVIFLALVFIALLILLAVFGLVIASLFDLFPQAVLPVWLQIPIAMTLGWLVYRRNADPLLGSLVAVIVMYATVILGAYLPFRMPDLFGIPSLIWWVVVLFVYCWFASILPVWKLLQPRDYINSHQLMTAMMLLALGVIVSRPEIVAPVINRSPSGAPPLWPFLFITIACGAISGFHSLVGSGTSSKQLNNESDAQFIGFGSMLLEGMLAVLVLISVAAGIGLRYEEGGVLLSGQAAFLKHYASWGAVEGLGSSVGAFVQGSANILSALGIPTNVAIALMGMFVASFAGTTLDTATRIQRYVITELAETTSLNFLKQRYAATFLAVFTATVLAFWPMRDPATGVLVYGKGGLILWPLFGASNQLLAALGLTVATVYLVKRGASWVYTAIPAAGMIVMTTWAMIYNLNDYLTTGEWHLFVIGAAIVLIEVLIVFEAGKVMRSIRGKPVTGLSPHSPATQ